MKNVMVLGGTWRLAGSEICGTMRTIEGNLPGEALLDLHEAGLIPDPFYATNAEQIKWVGERRWRTSASSISRGTSSISGRSSSLPASKHPP